MNNLEKPTLARVVGFIGALVFILAFTANSSAQLVAGPDTTICNGASVTLTAQTGNFAALSTVSLSDDTHSGVVPIGFTFTYYGNTYTQCVLASNNYITFDLTQANAYSPWAINNPIPNAGMPLNSIMCPYQDINPGNGGVIEYGTIGNAPNRIFVVRYLSVPMFSCTNDQFCSAIFLFEGTNRIETHIENKPLCAAWNGGAAIHGLHDDSGTLADVVPGRNFPTQWTAFQDGYEFVPNGPGAYTINPIPFQGLLSNNNTISWFQAPGGNLVGTGTTITVSPTTTTTYYAEATQVCGTGGGGLVDSVYVTVVNGTTPTLNVVDATCNGYTDGFVEFVPTGVNNPWDFEIQTPAGGVVSTINGATGVDTFSNLPAGSYNIIQTESNGCVVSIPVTIFEPDSVHVDVVADSIICIGGSATLTATGLDGNGAPYTLVWDQGLVGNGPHTVNPIAPTCYNVYALDVNQCQSETDEVCVNLFPPLVGNVPVVDSICPGQTATVSASVVGGSGQGYTYTWTGSDGSTYAGASIQVSPMVSTQYCVTITDDCETPPITECVDVGVWIIPPATFSTDTIEGCYPVTISFTNTTPANQVGSVLWEFGDDSTSTATGFVQHTYDLPGCYDVSLTVTSPGGCVADTTIVDYICAYPYPTADFDANPQPTTFFDPVIEFTNTSTDNLFNSWFFDDLGTSIEVDPSFEFPGNAPGTYPVQLVVTNQYNCSDAVTYDVIIEDAFLLYAPNAFTPNGDGINDFFFVTGGNIDNTDFELLIFSRWGNIIFRTTDINDMWDGTYMGQEVPIDTYVWKVKTRSASRGDAFEEIGHVTIVR